MSNATSQQSLLRGALYADAAASGALGFLMIVAAEPLSELLGLRTGFLRPVGLGFLPWAGLLVWLATRPEIPRRIAFAVVVLNLIYAADSVLLLFTGWVELTTLGYLFIVAQALAVAGLAELQWFGLRRASA